MPALSADRRTPRYQTPDGPLASYPVKANTTIYGGSLVQLDSNGYAIPAAKAANQVTVGRAEERAAGGSADGDTDVQVRAGVFLWGNLAADALARAEVGDACYVEDDQTVRKTQTGNGTKAGRVIAIDDAGVWVATGIPYLY